MRSTGLLLSTFVLLISAEERLAAQAPKFVPGDLSTLSCKILKSKREALGIVRLLVEVRNSGKHSAEPLSFQITRKGKKKKKKRPTFRFPVDMSRVSFPFAQRVGRPVPVGGRTTYWLQVASGKSDKLAVKVTEAIWLEGAAVPRPAIEIGPLRQSHRTAMLGHKASVSEVTLVNPLPQPLDAIFLATFTQPRDMLTLVSVRLPASVPHELLIQHVASTLDFATAAPHEQIRVTKLELVDWCLVAEENGELAQKSFMPAYEAWVRWSKAPSLSGKFNFQERDDDSSQDWSGSFSLDSKGSIHVKLSDSKTDESQRTKVESECKRTLAKAFADLLRPAGKELLTKNQIRTVANATFEIDGPGIYPESTGWQVSNAGAGSTATPNYRLEDGRIASEGTRENFGQVLWTTRTLGDGYIVTEKRSPNGQYTRHYSYTQIGSVVVPQAFREHFGMPRGGILRETTIRIHDLQIGGKQEVTTKPPHGPGVDALRTAWNAGYRYPEARGTLSADFTIETPGTDLVWQGEKTVKGTMKLKGFRGYMMDTSGWHEFDMKLKGASNTMMTGALSFIFSDRLLMWCGRDFTGRGSFEQIFAGTEIRAPRNGVFRFDNPTYSEITVRGGLIAGIKLSSGLERKLTWAKQGKVQVLTRIQTGEEELRAKWKRVAPGLFLPTKLEFYRVFGKSWGPEKISLRKLSITR